MIRLDKKLQWSSVILNEAWTTNCRMDGDRVPYDVDGAEVLSIIMYARSTINALAVYVDLAVQYYVHSGITIGLFQDDCNNTSRSVAFKGFRAGRFERFVRPGRLVTESLSFSYYTMAETTDDIRFSVRVGPGGAGIVYILPESKLTVAEHLSKPKMPALMQRIQDANSQ